MGKFLLLLLALILLVPRLLRLLVPRSPSPRGEQQKRQPRQDPEVLKDLTQQDISDADYEEIPPEE